MITITAVEAQNDLDQVLDTVQREPVTITRDGRVVAFMVSEQDMQDLQDARRKRGAAVEAFESFFAKNKDSFTAAAQNLTDEDVVRLVHESR